MYKKKGFLKKVFIFLILLLSFNNLYAEIKSNIDGTYKGRMIKVIDGNTIKVLAIPSMIASNYSSTEIEDIAESGALVTKNSTLLPPSYGGGDGELNNLYSNSGSYILYDGNISDLSYSSNLLELVGKFQDVYSNADFVKTDEINKLLDINLSSLSDNDLKNIKLVIKYDLGLEKFYNISDTNSDGVVNCNDLTQTDVSKLNNWLSTSKTKQEWCALTEVNLSNRSLTSIIDPFYKLTQLKKIDLSNNEIRYFLPNLANFKNLEDFNVSNNKVEGVSGYIGSLLKLKNLDLSNNKISFISKDLSNLINLEEFDLSGNSELGTLSQNFNVSSAKLTAEVGENGENIGIMGDGSKVIITVNGYNQAFNIINCVDGIQDSDVDVLNNLTGSGGTKESWCSAESLNLSGKSLTNVSDSIFKLSNLKNLYLNDNEITSISKEVSNLRSLEKLYLHNNNITDLPEELYSLVGLKQLYLNSNKLTSLSSSIGKLSNLEHLGVSYNELTNLPDEIYNLSLLTNLYLNNNQITEIKSDISKLSNLTHLYLSDNKITSLPSSIWDLNKIVELSARYSGIEEIGANIENFSDLKILDISGNSISSIPDSIYNLTNLEVLKLDANKIESISELPPQK